MDFGELFQRFFWLIFPVMSMIWGMIDLSARHRRAREGLQVIKSYIDQGKEPPPELLKFLEAKPDNKFMNKGGWAGVFVFAAMSGGFLMIAWWPGMGFEPRQVAGLHFVALIMGALCLGTLVAVLWRERDQTLR